MKTKLIIGLTLGGLLIGGVAAAQVVRGAYDEPGHDVILEDGRFEVRRYAQRIVAETTVSTEDWRRATSTGFGRLADFIFGANQADDGESQKIAMTTPVESVPDGGEVTVMFTMPEQHSIEDLPRPNDEQVVIRTVPAETVAVLRFSGSARKQDIATLREQLLDAIDQHEYEATGKIRVAQYDPPWTPGFLRRNELMITVAEP